VGRSLPVMDNIATKVDSRTMHCCGDWQCDALQVASPVINSSVPQTERDWWPLQCSQWSLQATDSQASSLGIEPMLPCSLAHQMNRGRHLLLETSLISEQKNRTPGDRILCRCNYRSIS